jgi:steroid 5-alpha reductase family enzyme
LVREKVVVMATPRGKTSSLTLVTVAYVVACAVAAAWLAWGPATRHLWLDTLIADVVATVVVFAFSRSFGNSSFYDAYWSVAPPVILGYWWSQTSNHGVRSWLLAVVVFLWALRLTANWVSSFPGLHHEDWRYPMMREQAGRMEFVVDFVGIHLFPTLIVYAALVPGYVALAHAGNGIGWLDAVAYVVGIGAVLLELVADTQLHRFTRNRKRGDVMDTGLWSWSRHPNYFGEFSFWVSLALFGVAAAPAAGGWACLGAVAILAMFLGASIPMMETRSLERRPQYQEVVDRVSRFVPRPPRRSSARS